MDKKDLSRVIDKIVSESLNEAYQEFIAEQRRIHHIDSIINESVEKVLNEKKGKKKKKKTGKKKPDIARSAEVYKTLKKDGINTAEFAYKCTDFYHPNDEEEEEFRPWNFRKETEPCAE